jgi:hypothetical protein
LFNAPSIDLPYCPFCGRPATNRHHAVPRSQGGTKGAIITVCGLGNMTGCHAKLHNHTLHVRYTGKWEYLYTEQPTKYQAALSMEGWETLYV